MSPMDIGNNLTTGNHFSPYTNSYAIGGGESQGAEGASPGPVPVRFPSAGDSLIAMGTSYSYALNRESSGTFTATRRARWRVVYLISGSVSGVSIALFILFAAQPLLVVIFTLGGCLSRDGQEWLEFSKEVLQTSLVPLAAGLVAGLIAGTAYLIQRRLTA
jgi:hypothetical protein